MGVVGQQEVEVVESCMVKPSDETPSHGLWLSQLDLRMVNRGHTPNVYFYSPDSGDVDNFFDVARLKAAMAKVLVPFYPLAGRLGADGDGRPEINCACQGVLFVVARSNLTVDGFVDFRQDSPSIMCAIQVTFMGCGGVALGTALHHVAIDAVSAVHFFQTWSGFCKDGDAAAAVLELPCHDRTLLRALPTRRPRTGPECRCSVIYFPVVHPDALTVFSCPKLSLAVSAEPSGTVVNKIFVLSKDQVAALKRACTDGRRVSTFCAMSAHVWRSFCTAGRLPTDATTRLTFPANIRGALRPPLPARYYGNGIIVLGAAGRVRDIESEELGSVARRISGAVRRMDDELVRSVIDYLEINGSKQPPSSMPETELRVISWLGMPQRAGFVYLMDGVSGSGGVRILVLTEAAILNDFQHLLPTSGFNFVFHHWSM
ncbi:hypothetical protein VPH35_063363 [Triticum aestivum]